MLEAVRLLMRLAGRLGAPVSMSSSEFSCRVGRVAECDMEYWLMLTGSSLPMSAMPDMCPGAWLVLTLVLGPPGVTRLAVMLAVLLLSLTPL